MKRMLKTLSLALVACAVIVGLAACGGKAATNVSLSSGFAYDAWAKTTENSLKGSGADQVGQPTQDATSKLVTIKVPADTSLIMINLGTAFGTAEGKMKYGKDVTFTVSGLSGVSGTGYIYEYDSGSGSTMKYKKSGQGEAMLDTEFNNGLAMFKWGDSIEFNIAAARGVNTEGKTDNRFDKTKAFTADKTFTINFKDQDGKKFKLEVKIELKEAAE